MRALRYGVLSACLFSCSWALAERDDFNKNYAWEPEKRWEESQVTPPAWPQDGDWQSFYTAVTVKNTVSIALPTLQVADDKVVRYVLKISSPEGAENVSFQGLRCETGEFKLYAIGRPAEKTWSPTRNSEWKRLQPGHYAQVALARDYLCEDKRASPIENMVKALKSR